MNAKKIIQTLTMALMAMVATAQSYVGTMEVNGYTRKEVVVQLAKTKQGELVLKMFNVKFARLMPVKVDVDIPGITLNGSRLQGNNIIPSSKGKPYERYRVTKLDGKADSQQISFTCMMGDKPVKFSGKRKK